MSDAEAPQELESEHEEEPPQPPRRGPNLWWFVILLAVGIALLISASSWEVYQSTSPDDLGSLVFGEGNDENDEATGGISITVALRKFYSVLAFGLVALIAHKALGPSRHPTRRAIVVGALFSTAIEISQYVNGVREGLLSNLFDIFCGALGGWLVAVIFRFSRR